ncbi:aromatic-ring-hydroxylating dioxygenase subunit beta [Microbacterium sp. LMC-P-041]|uniref:aromatic-ring-hydroxylating dioxygenase subunit beta n=1 Tax=Microbacterium sp. LMC-P-041 TaxID=3040293 RepID=UPI0025534684|nr:aromatic-ring-hydroxylating dioxygenase subunit beta [Microbacterium sp. LMC-P-041]
MTESTKTTKAGAWVTGRGEHIRQLPVADVRSDDWRMVRAMDLVNREAELLDHREYEKWQELYSKDALYIIPIEQERDDFENTLNMVYDDATMRAMRVTRMTEGYAIAAVDAAATARTLGRVVPASITEGSNWIDVRFRAVQSLFSYKRGVHEVWVGEIDFSVRLGASAADDRIVRKVIRLIDGDDVVSAAGFLP